VPDLILGFKEAAKSIPDLSLYIFGGGPNEAEYKALAAAEPTGNIVFCGQTPVLRPYLEAADVFVLASLADPAPLAICEAREAGLAVLGTRVDGIPELLEYGQAGLLIEPNSPQMLGRELVKLFSDAQALATWKQNSQIRIDRLTVRRVAEQTVDVYRECVR
jgi:glycosyltransferase involved in cell wall biosynthesis